MAEKRLGDILIEGKFITPEQLKLAIEEHEHSGRHIGSILVKLGFLKIRDLANVLSKQFGVPTIDIEAIDIPVDVIKLLSSKAAHRYLAIPVKKEEKELTVAVTNPTDFIALDEISFLTGCKIKPVVVPEISIRKMLEKYYHLTDEDITAKVIETKSPADLVISNKKEDETGETTASKIVDKIIRTGIEYGATHIHYEPFEGSAKFRFRIGGTVKEVMTPPKETHNEIVNRLKVLAKMNISEKNKPQDGIIRTTIGNKTIILNVSTYPTLFGESITIKLQYRHDMIIEIERLGMTEKTLGKYRQLLSKQKGVFIITGPVKSGKTSTLYATLQFLNSPNKNVFTLEDPIEYQLKGINQGRIDDKVGLSYHDALEAVLKQEPDIIMISKLPDQATAELAFQSSRANKLILTTLDVPDSYRVFSYFIDQDISPLLLSTSIIGVLSQRLVRKLCDNCKEAYTPSENLLKELNISTTKQFTFYKERGCPQCKMTGFTGYTGIFELLEVDEKIERLIVYKSIPENIKKSAIESGMTTLQRDGLIKVIQGITTLDEVLRVTYSPGGKGR